MADGLRIERRDATSAWPEVKTLAEIVYTPELAAHDEWHDVVWSHAEEWLMGYCGDTLVSVAGIHRRTVEHNGVAQQIAGIGGVKTHPAYEKRGFSTAVLEATKIVIDEEIGPAFSVIFVEAHNRLFYAKRGWQVFDGIVIVEQDGDYVKFHEQGTMVRDGAEAAPVEGTIDLKGRPW
ncbi:MAG: GNAT family N-acetyltransferase [Sphingomonadaceae bacterium]|nr:GNAT family N-acetyltransferase [Sphingomonadaceae bacterium]